MPVIDLKVDKSLLHKATKKIVVSGGSFVEVDSNDDALRTHHLQSMVLSGTRGVLFVVDPARAQVTPAPAPCVPKAPTPELVRYEKSCMKSVYDKLKKAASTGVGDVDAKAILDLLKKAEVPNE